MTQPQNQQNKAIAAYQKTAVTTASRGEILVALYDGAIHHVQVAQAAIIGNRPEKKGEAIGKAMSILTELLSTLNPEHAPELVENLKRLYVYCIDRLQIASVHLDPKPLDEVIRHLMTLREAYNHVVKQGL